MHLELAIGGVGLLELIGLAIQDAGKHQMAALLDMLTWILEHAGLKPGFLVGGVPLNFGVSARLGEGNTFVIEADEYDTAFFDKRSKFVHYRPRTAVLNNLEFDHDLHDARVLGLGEFFHFFQQLDLGSAVQRGDGVQPLVKRAAAGDATGRRLHAGAFAAGGNAAHRARRIQQRGFGNVVGIGKGSFLAAHGTHAHALVDAEGTGLHDAFFEAPAFAAGVLEIQVGVVRAMLPDEIVKSYTLQEGRNCPALSLYLTLDEATLEIRESVTRLELVPIVSNLRHDVLDSTFTEAFFEAAQTSPPTGMQWGVELTFLHRLAKHLKAQREIVRGKPENFNRPDYNFRLDNPTGGEPQGNETVSISTRQRGAPLDLIVAEAMILANSTWGQWLAEHSVPGIYRSQASLAPGVKVRMVVVFWIAWVAGDAVATVLFALIAFFALREFITLSPTRRGDHRSLVLAFFVVLPVQFWLAATRHFDLFTVFIPVYVFLAIPVASALSGDSQRFLERNAKLQWGIVVCVYGMSPSAPE